jgi:Phage integrase family
VPALRQQLDTYSGSGPDGLVFPNEHGNPLHRGNFNKAVSWETVRAGLGVPNLHLHDLRHTGNTLAAQSGASLRDLMARMGHDSPAAALLYQHSTRAADEAIAAAIDARLAALGQIALTRRPRMSSSGTRLTKEFRYILDMINISGFTVERFRAAAIRLRPAHLVGGGAARAGWRTPRALWIGRAGSGACARSGRRC